MPSERCRAEPCGGAIAGIVLAAGTSTRMGRNKLFLELDGETIVHRAVRRAIEAGLDPVFVVVGHEADRVREAIDTLKCQAGVQPELSAGVNSSLVNRDPRRLGDGRAGGGRDARRHAVRHLRDDRDARR